MLNILESLVPLFSWQSMETLDDGNLYFLNCVLKKDIHNWKAGEKIDAIEVGPNSMVFIPDLADEDELEFYFTFKLEIVLE